MATVVLVGTMDTKGAEYDFVRQRLAAAGIDTLIVDCGVLGLPQIMPDISREAVAQAGGADVRALAQAGDRGAAVEAMARGAEAILRRLLSEGRLQGAMALGGGGGTSIAARAFQALPLGVPKIIVSTMASGDTRAYVGESDLILIPSVVDVAGVNRVSARVMSNAAAAMAGMVGAPPVPDTGTKPLIAASMFGVTTPCVTEGRRLLEARGATVLIKGLRNRHQRMARRAGVLEALRTREHQFVELEDAVAHARSHVARQLAGQPVPTRRR